VQEDSTSVSKSAPPVAQPYELLQSFLIETPTSTNNYKISMKIKNIVSDESSSLSVGADLISVSSVSSLEESFALRATKTSELSRNNLPDCWNSNQYQTFKETYVKNEKLGSSVCEKYVTKHSKESLRLTYF
jgi:hypothetical protein